MNDATSTSAATGNNKPIEGETVFSPASYESEAILNFYLQFHYGIGAELYPYATFGQEIREALAFIRNVAQKFQVYAPVNINGRVLDLGCAVGGSCFELSKFFPEVIGIDLSRAFIAAANRIKQEKSITYDSILQGEVTVRRTANLDSDVNPSRVSFRVEDAIKLCPSIGTFDAILCCNLLDRVTDPRKLLDTFPLLINQGGVLVFLTPFSWFEKYTPHDKWIGGRAGETKCCEEQLKEIMSDNGLELLEEENVPFVIPEHIRRYQLGVSYCTVWRRK
jgi:putative 4-mercaptohistidine N1-methyltranferase